MQINITKSLIVQPNIIQTLNEKVRLSFAVQGDSEVEIEYSVNKEHPLRFLYNNTIASKIRFTRRLSGIADGDNIDDNVQIHCKMAAYDNETYKITATVREVSDSNNYDRTSAVINISMARRNESLNELAEVKIILL